MDFATVSQLNPSLIYASVTGYGQTGPYRRRAGYDVMVEAEMGLMHITGPRDGPPVKVGVAVTDLTTGLYASNSIMAALIGRARTGKGQHIDIALSDCQVATLANFASSALISGEPDKGRWGTAHRKLADPSFTHPSSWLHAQCQLNSRKWLSNSTQRPSFPTQASKPPMATSYSAEATIASSASCATAWADQNGRWTLAS